MTGLPTPTRDKLLAAFTEHGVQWRAAPLLANAEGRPWSQGLRAIVNHHTAGTSSLDYLLNKGGTYPFVNALVQRDGYVVILSCLSVWGSGAGGPWPGVADKDELHLVAWQTEVEDPGVGQTFTPEQMEARSRLHAALVDLGVPPGNEINHRDWTDGNPPVGGYPLPTRGRKVDTRYDGDTLRALTDAARIRPPKPDPKPPVLPSTGDPTGEEHMLVIRQTDDKGPAFYLLSGGQLVSVAAADAKGWTGQRWTITDPGTWERVSGAYAPRGAT